MSEANAYYEAHGKTIEAAHARLWHWDARRKHPKECQCKFCASNGEEPCTAENPCSTCRKDQAEAAPPPVEVRMCRGCGQQIDPERLEALPDTPLCVACARANPEGPKHDPNQVCARASGTGRNGFAPSD